MIRPMASNCAPRPKLRLPRRPPRRPRPRRPPRRQLPKRPRKRLRPRRPCLQVRRALALSRAWSLLLVMAPLSRRPIGQRHPSQAPGCPRRPRQRQLLSPLFRSQRFRSQLFPMLLFPSPQLPQLRFPSSQGNQVPLRPMALPKQLRDPGPRLRRPSLRHRPRVLPVLVPERPVRATTRSRQRRGWADVRQRPLVAINSSAPRDLRLHATGCLAPIRR